MLKGIQDVSFHTALLLIYLPFAWSTVTCVMLDGEIICVFSELVNAEIYGEFSIWVHQMMLAWKKCLPVRIISSVLVFVKRDVIIRIVPEVVGYLLLFCKRDSTGTPSNIVEA